MTIKPDFDEHVPADRLLRSAENVVIDGAGKYSQLIRRVPLGYFYSEAPKQGFWSRLVNGVCNDR